MRKLNEIEKIYYSAKISVDVIERLKKASKRSGFKINSMVEKSINEFIDNHNLLADIGEPTGRDSPGKEAPA